MLRALGGLAIALLVLSACGGAGSPLAATTAPTATPSAAATVAATSAPSAAATVVAGGNDVTVQGFKFGPQTLEVKVGTKVTWTNKDTANHTTTSGKPGAKNGKWDFPLAGSGGTASFTFTQAGSFDYFCSIHPATMLGTVVVK